MGIEEAFAITTRRFVQRKNFGYPKKFKAFLSEASQTYEKLNTAIARYASTSWSLVSMQGFH